MESAALWVHEFNQWKLVPRAIKLHTNEVWMEPFLGAFGRLIHDRGLSEVSEYDT